MEHDFEEELIEEGKESPIKKVVIVFIAVFLIMLFVSYVGISYGISDIIGGMAESNLISGNTVEVDDYSIIFDDGPLEGLNELYVNNKELEFKACLGGEIVDGDYYINEIVYPEMYSQKYNQVVAEPCPADSLIDLHSHPEKRCIASQQDMKNFEAMKERNPDALMVILCEEDRMNVYG